MQSWATSPPLLYHLPWTLTSSQNDHPNFPTRSQELTAEVKTPWLKTAAENEERNEHQTDHFISRLSRTQKMLEQAITFLITCSPYLAGRTIYSDLLWGVTQPQSHMQFQQRTVKGFSCPVLVKTHRKSYLGSERRLHCIDIAMMCSPITPTQADHWKLRCWYVKTWDGLILITGLAGRGWLAAPDSP